MSHEKNTYFHYAWCIVIGGFIIMALLHSMIHTCFSLFLPAVTDYMHISNTAFSGCSSIVAIASMLVAPKMGKYMQNSHQFKSIMTICIIGTGLSYASYGFATSIIHMYISGFCLGIFSCGATILPITIILVRWFHKNTGLAIGITLSGSGIGGSIISPFLTDFISTYGWRRSFILFGILMIVIEVPVAYFMMIPNPEDIGYKPYGMTSDRASASPLKNLPFQDLKKHTFFYIYLIGIFCICVAGYGSLGYLSASLTENYGPSMAYAIIPFFLFLLTPAKIFLGWLYDHIRTEICTIYVSFTFATAFILLQISNNESLMWIMAIFFSLGISAGTVIPSFITYDFFDSDDFGSLFGFVYAVCMGAMAVGNPLLAAIYDLTNSYDLAWSACASFCILSGICIVYIAEKKQRHTML